MGSSSRAPIRTFEPQRSAPPASRSSSLQPLTGPCWRQPLLNACGAALQAPRVARRPAAAHLQHAGAEGGGLAGTGLRLLDHVQALAKGHDALLLDGGGLLETCGARGGGVGADGGGRRAAERAGTACGARRLRRLAGRAPSARSAAAVLHRLVADGPPRCRRRRCCRIAICGCQRRVPLRPVPLSPRSRLPCSSVRSSSFRLLPAPAGLTRQRVRQCTCSSTMQGTSSAATDGRGGAHRRRRCRAAGSRAAASGRRTRRSRSSP